MRRCCGREGSVGQFEEPVWGPLLSAVGERLAATFMWMNDVELECGTLLHAYKHIYTRRYLYLDEQVRAYELAPCGCYVPLRLDFALEATLCHWWILAGWEEEDAVAIREAIVAANSSAAAEA